MSAPGGDGDEDARLFREAMNDVAPLSKRDRRPSMPVQPPPARRRAEPPALVVEDHNGTVTGRPPGMSRKQLAAQRRALPHLDDTIDLHKLTAAQARAELRTRVTAAHASGARCLLIIHGRGHHSTDGVSVLRGTTIELLARGPVRPLVHCFATAAPRHGGLGALYLWLAATA